MRALILVLMFLVSGGVAHAGEGMWLPDQLPMIAGDLHSAGLDAPPEQFADLTGHPMGAIVSLGGCSASFVSPHGLIATNHHCAYGTIQFNSTAECNLLEDGFLAETENDELPAAPGSRVYVTVAFEDVTNQVLEGIPAEATGAERFEAIEQAEKSLIAACEETAGHRCSVSSFFGGAMYRLYDQLEIRDVRLAYAPPSSIGKFGGDIDNWMWPRHTGDFALYRAWVGPDGQPADPSPDNVPFTPPHWLRIGTDGVEEGDFVMVVGFPGRTNRYRLASEVAHAIEWTYPQRVARLGESLEIIDRETTGRPQAAMAYAAWVSYINNSLKNAQGMLAGFQHSESVSRKRALEHKLADWIAADPERSRQWGNAISDLEDLLEVERAHRARDQELGLLSYNQLMSAAGTAYRLARERELPDIERSPGYQNRDLPRIKARIALMSKSFDARVSRALLQRTLERYAALPVNDRLTPIDTWFGLDGHGNPASAIAQKLDEMYAQSSLVDADARAALLGADRAKLEASDDPFVRFAVATYETDRALEREEEALEGRLSEARPRFMKALLAFQRSRNEEIYPDANGTLRVTFGRVKGYEPQDAVLYRPFTTAAGVAAKATGTEPFNAPTELIAAIKADDFGPYRSAKTGTLPVNFLSTVDTTGGNSGSATLDDQGRLVGLLFDGNWESMISDWDFLTDVTRSIHVDIRYALWVMDRFDGAWRLLEEMGVPPAFREPTE